jgi:hypothetical protein
MDTIIYGAGGVVLLIASAFLFTYLEELYKGVKRKLKVRNANAREAAVKNVAGVI